MKLPPGVKLKRTLRGHTGAISRIAWSPEGKLLASPSADGTIRLWNVETGECLRILKGNGSEVNTVAFDPTGQSLASGGNDKTVKLWNAASGKLVRRWEGHILSVAFNASGQMLAGGGGDATVKLWKAETGELILSLKGDSVICAVAFDRDGNTLSIATDGGTIIRWDVARGRTRSYLAGHQKKIFGLAVDSSGVWLASASADNTIKLWDTSANLLVRTLEGHTDAVNCVDTMHGSRLLASKSSDQSVRVWSPESGICVATIPEPSGGWWISGLAFHPTQPLLATVGSDPGTRREERDRVVHIWELDLAVLLGQPVAQGVTYTSAKIVLVGDSGVGKTGLGWRLAHGGFKEHASTHGQQFWLLDQLRKMRADGAQCEAILWDLAGQPDYRLIHALFLDDADLALVLFDPAHTNDPLHGVEFWLKQLKVPTLLVAARSDRGSARLTTEEIEAFCHQRGLRGYACTSAFGGQGVDELMQKMQALIRWDEKPATVTTDTFKRIKDYVLGLKEDRKVILTGVELRNRLQQTDADWEFTNDEMLTAVGHLSNHGLVTKLKTSQGEPRILLAPDLLNNLAASLVLEARRQVKGLGSLEEQRLLSGEYEFPELEKLSPDERDVLLDSATLLFLEHNVCFRETDPLNSRTYLVFPELINLKRPSIDEEVVLDEGVAYTVCGSVENVYASLVVLLGYTHTFTRTNQWKSQARYEVGNGMVCAFRQESEREGELQFVLSYAANVSEPIRMLFQSLFESFLARRNLTVQRYEPVTCSNGHRINRVVVRDQIAAGLKFAFCAKCGKKASLPKVDKPIQLTRQQSAEMDAQRKAADQRSRFEQAAFRWKSWVTDQKLAPPECFISYAWGNPDHERWVEHSLATDLLKAGVTVILDRWENQRIGASVPRFVERAAKCDFIIVVGTALYRRKYDNKKPKRGFVVAAEGDLIGNRMLGTEAEKESVLPILLKGTTKTAFPHLLHPRVYADFTNTDTYFDTVFDLILSLYQIPHRHPVATELRGTLRG